MWFTADDSCAQIECMRHLGWLVTLWLPCAAFAQAPAGVEPEALYASPTRFDRIGRIVAPVMINGQGPFRLVVDTGASHTTLSPELVARLGLDSTSEDAVMLNGVTGAEVVPAVTIAHLQAGELIVEGARAPVVHSDIMAGADGILGIAGLTRERILVDFRKDRIVIARSKNQPEDRNLLRIPAQRVAGGLLMVITRVGGVNVRAIIDTGAERSLGNAALAEALRKRGKLLPPRPTFVFGTTTTVTSGELRGIPPVMIGDATISQVNLVFGDFHIFKVWDLEDKPTMLIGMDVLGTVSRLIIDYRRREVYVLS
jgi:predicted aspartyl protease